MRALVPWLVFLLMMLWAHNSAPYDVETCQDTRGVIHPDYGACMSLTDAWRTVATRFGGHYVY